MSLYIIIFSHIQTGTPKWQQPCIKTLSCEQKDNSNIGGNFWIIFAIAGAVLLGVMILGWLLCFCSKNSK